MKKILGFLAGFLIIAVIISLIIFALLKNIGGPSEQNPPRENPQIYVQPSSQTATQQPEQVQAEISKDFHSQVPDSDKVYLSSVAVVSNYAVADWTDGYSGGMSLFVLESSGNWKIIAMDGGVIDTSDMVNAGVPDSIAQQLSSQLHTLESN